MSRVGALLHKDRAVEDLCWQKSQTTKWWEEAQKRGNQLVRMRVRQDRVGKKLWETRQALHEVQTTLHEIQSALEQTERQLAWWREKYRRTLTARIRRAARILINATLKISRNRNQ